MIFSLLRARRRGQGIEPLYQALMVNALDPGLFLDAAIPDTFEGRFESVTVHAALVLRRLRSLPPPAADLAQELVDRVFDGVDAAMRESGISDVGVPKRIKKFAQGFYGRLEAYSAALDAGDNAALADALRRNVLAGEGDAKALSAYVSSLERALAGLDTAALAAGHWPAIKVGAVAP